MEIICFGIGLIAGLLIASRRGGADAAPKTHGEEMPKELLEQYQELFGYNGRS